MLSNGYEFPLTRPADTLSMSRYKIPARPILPHPSPLPSILRSAAAEDGPGEGEWPADGLKRRTSELVQGFNAD
jgi:hypothetical protein